MDFLVLENMNYLFEEKVQKISLVKINSIDRYLHYF